MDLDLLVKEAALMIKQARSVVALTGAGISVESGIPAFRGAQGLWEKYDPMEYAHIDAFRLNPAKVWKMLIELHQVVQGAKPNAAHMGLAEMERMGYLRAIITQNIDNLHQEAGSRYVIEFHGNGNYLVCLSCNNKMPSTELSMDSLPPRCSCGGVLKPDVVFFGEPIPWKALVLAQEESKNCQVMMVIGTSALVAPACDMPLVAKSAGARIIEINMEETHLTQSVTDIFLKGPAGKIIPKIMEALCAEA